MSDNPYRIEGPALISFSGGRTSAYMLWHILDAHGGQLPEDVHVTFANTGKEREETLRFVHECATRWNVRVRWLEWRRRERGSPWQDGFEEVGFNSASRSGEPFSALIRQRGFLPNAVHPNGCSMLYAASERAAKAKGYRRGLTYLLASEWDRFVHLTTGEQRTDAALANDPMWKRIGGASVRAAGWRELWRVKGRSWDCESRPRSDKHPTEDKVAIGWGAWARRSP